MHKRIDGEVQLCAHYAQWITIGTSRFPIFQLARAGAHTRSVSLFNARLLLLLSSKLTAADWKSIERQSSAHVTLPPIFYSWHAHHMCSVERCRAEHTLIPLHVPRFENGCRPVFGPCPFDPPDAFCLFDGLDSPVLTVDSSDSIRHNCWDLCMRPFILLSSFVNASQFPPCNAPIDSFKFVHYVPSTNVNNNNKQQ